MLRQVRSGLVMLGQVNTGYNMIGYFKTPNYRLGQNERLGQVRIY
jgi:hypothetical protein